MLVNVFHATACHMLFIQNYLMFLVKCHAYIINSFKDISIIAFTEGPFNNYVTQNYKILTYLPIFVTLFYNKI